MSKNGVLAPLSIARGDNTVYFLGERELKFKYYNRTGADRGTW